MKFAVVNKDGQVVNLIVGDETQKAELEAITGMELVDAQPFALRIGDLRVGKNWTRNVRGEQTVLTGLPTYSDLERTAQKQAQTLSVLGGENLQTPQQAVILRDAMREVMAVAAVESPSVSIGNLAAVAEPWEVGKQYKKGELFLYDGNIGFARQAVTALEVYPPFSTGTEAIYGVRPPADVNGVYPYVYNMRAEPGMLVREDEVVYKCIAAAPVDPVLYAPSQTPALFERADMEV